MDFQSELLDVKNVSDCEELATVDAYNDDEVAAGWLTCLEEVFEGIESVKVLDRDVSLTGFDIERDHAVLAICKSGKKTAHVSLSSIEWPKLSKAQQLWLKAWNRYGGNG
jgi:hypothetical protein